MRLLYGLFVADFSNCCTLYSASFVSLCFINKGVIKGDIQKLGIISLRK